MTPSAWLDLAARRNARQIERTPLTCASEFDQIHKLEDQQVRGSHTLHGALCVVGVFACLAADVVGGKARG